MTQDKNKKRSFATLQNFEVNSRDYIANVTKMSFSRTRKTVGTYFGHQTICNSQMKKDFYEETKHHFQWLCARASGGTLKEQ